MNGFLYQNLKTKQMEKKPFIPVIPLAATKTSHAICNFDQKKNHKKPWRYPNPD